MKKGKLICLCLSVLLLTACSQVKNDPKSNTRSTDMKQSQSENVVSSESSSSSNSEASSEISTTPSSERQSQPKATGMNLGDIQSGDFSSVKGTWKNGRGDTLIFGEGNSITLDGYNMYYKGALPGADTTINIAGDGANSGATIKFALPGTPFVFGQAEDVSDTSKERIWSGQGYSKDPAEFFYRVD